MGGVKFCFSLTGPSGRPTPKLRQQFGRIDSHWFSALKIVVAVARKLAVLVHRIWITQEPYMPFYEQAA